MSTSETPQLRSIGPATEVLGDKWTPQLLRYFLTCQTVRFCQLQDFVGGINPRTLSARLVRLEAQGIITKSSGNVRCDYMLTQKGKDLLPILEAMENWSDRYESNYATKLA